MKHFALMWGFIGRIVAIRAALEYDLGTAGYAPELTGAAGLLWQTNMNAWKAAWKATR